MRDGQIRHSCVRGDEGPGKPLPACRKVSVTLTLLHPDDKHDLRGFADKGGMSAEVRQRQVVRIVEEAREQGRLLMQEDLSGILTCDPRNPSLLRSHTKLHRHLQAGAASIGEPGPAVGLDIGEGVILHYDNLRKELVGVTLIGLRARLVESLAQAQG